MDAYQINKGESVTLEVEGNKTTSNYQSVLNGFKELNLLFQQMHQDNQPALFIFNVKSCDIEYGDVAFLKSHQIVVSQVNRSPIRKLLQRCVKQIELNKLSWLESTAPCNNDFFSTVVNYCDLNGCSCQYYIQMLKCNDLLANEHLRIGIQFNLTMSGLEESLASHFYLDCRQQLLDLSNRELEVVSNIIKGDTDCQIAEKLHISVYTAKKHRKNILKKVKLKNTALLAYMVGKMNLF